MFYQKVSDAKALNAIDEESNVKLDNDSDPNVCKYCHEVGGKMIKPCNCNDSVHYKCLNDWQKSRSGSKDKCEICKTPYYSKRIFNRKECLFDSFYYPLMILLNLFMIFGCAGYEIFDKLKDKNIPIVLPIIFASFYVIFGIFLGPVPFVLGDFPYYIRGYGITRKKLLMLVFICHTIMQIIPVIICSIIFDKFFWNLATFGMTITFLLIIGLIGFLIFGLIMLVKPITSFLETTYTDERYYNKPTVSEPIAESVAESV